MPTGTPRVYPSMLEWVQRQADTTGGTRPRYQKILDAETIEPPGPKGLDQVVDIFEPFRTIQLPEAYVAVVPGGYACGGGRELSIAVMTPERELIWDASSHWDAAARRPAGRVENYWVFDEVDLPPATSIPETVGVLAIRPSWSNNYFHWMFEVLPRIHLLRESGISLDKYVINARKQSFQRETLDSLGLDESSFIELDSPFHISARELVFPSQIPLVAPAWACTFLRNAFLDTAPLSGRDRLYLTRASASRGRTVINEDRVREVLEKFKFKEFLPDQVSVTEQAQAFASAGAIVAPHGSALTNLVFCRPGTKVVELFAPTYLHHGYWMMSGQCNLDYYYLIGKAERPGERSRWPSDVASLDPIEIDPDQLVEVLTTAGL